jgi:mRNA interferase HigB
MHIISIKMLRTFWQKHPKAEKGLRECHTIGEHAFRDFQKVMTHREYDDWNKLYRQGKT